MALYLAADRPRVTIAEGEGDQLLTEQLLQLAREPPGLQASGGSDQHCRPVRCSCLSMLLGAVPREVRGRVSMRRVGGRLVPTLLTAGSFSQLECG